MVHRLLYPFARRATHWHRRFILQSYPETYLDLCGISNGLFPRRPALEYLGAILSQRPTPEPTFLDRRVYLPSDLLYKLDVATMAHSLEGRVPFLDPEVWAFARRVPRELKVRGSLGKYLLKRLLCRYYPPELVYRPKQGFSIPLRSYLLDRRRADLQEALGAMTPMLADLGSPRSLTDRLAGDSGLLDLLLRRHPYFLFGVLALHRLSHRWGIYW